MIRITNVRAAGLILALGSACTVAPPPATFVDVVSGAGVDPLTAPPGGAAVLVFITADCPIANGFAPQLKAMMAAWQGRPVKFTLVHVDPLLSRERARKHAADYGYRGGVIMDPAHRLVVHTGVRITPEAVVYDAYGQLRYRGRVNNWYGDIGRKRPEPTKHELRDAIEAVLDKRPVPVSRAAAVGCTIEPLRS